MRAGERVRTGIPGLDELIEGGFVPGKAYLITGPPGSGKTTFAMQFLVEGARNDKRVAYISLVHNPEEVLKDFERFDQDVREYVARGTLSSMTSVRSSGVRPQSHPSGVALCSG